MHTLEQLPNLLDREEFALRAFYMAFKPSPENDCKALDLVSMNFVERM